MPWRWSLHIVSADGEVFADFIAELKQSIPSRRRKWDGDRKFWLFQEDAAIEFVTGLLVHYGLTYAFDEAETGAPVQMTHDAAYATLHLLPTAPTELITAAYRILAKESHPDVGGVLEDMQRLNSAAEVLRNGRL